MKTKIKKYSMEEVKKHNKIDDAWIVINNTIYDITKWIPKHPGGNIILNGIGKNATSLFNNIGHSKNALKILQKYNIGKLI